MDDGEKVVTTRAGARWWVLIVLAVAVLVVGSVLLMNHRSAANRWLNTYKVADTGALNDDLIQLQQDLTLPSAKVVPALRFDCFGGRRDVARALSHPLPDNPRLGVLYHNTLEQIATTYETCLSLVDAKPATATATVITRIRQEIGVATSHALLVNAQADHLRYGAIFAFSN